VKFEILTAVNKMMFFSPQDGDSMFLQNVRICLRVYTVSNREKHNLGFLIVLIGEISGAHVGEYEDGSSGMLRHVVSQKMTGVSDVLNHQGDYTNDGKSKKV
jgi:hypothetical protein